MTPAAIETTLREGSLAEVFVSIDVEADGPIPGAYSMLSFAAVAFNRQGQTFGEYTANLVQLPGAQAAPEIMAWWENFPDAWQAARRNPRPPERVLPEFCAWLKALPGVPIFVGWPATWDFMWIYWYLTTFTGERPFSEHGIDIRSLAMGRLQRNFGACEKRGLPERLLPSLPHTHVALDDAREQAQLFLNLLYDGPALGMPESGILVAGVE